MGTVVESFLPLRLCTQRCHKLELNHQSANMEKIVSEYQATFGVAEYSKVERSRISYFLWHRSVLISQLEVEGRKALLIRAGSLYCKWLVTLECIRSRYYCFLQKETGRA